MNAAAHIAELTLRRHFAGELDPAGSEDVKKHASSCPDCRAKLLRIESEQAQFEKEISFDRFKAGVERSVRLQAQERRTPYGLVAMAAAAALLLFLGPLSSRILSRGNGIKGGDDEVTLKIAPAHNGPQRDGSTTTPELLSPGDRVRIGYKSGTHRYVAVVSVDAAGEVTPLYPEKGEALEVGPSQQTRYLPDSIEFTGKGAETIVTLLIDAPVQVADVVSAAKAAFGRANGDVSKLPRVFVPGDEVHRVVIKP